MLGTALKFHIAVKHGLKGWTLGTFIKLLLHMRMYLTF